MIVGELLETRHQLILRGEWDTASGWDDPLNHWIAQELGRIRTTVGVLTTEKALPDQKDLNDQRSKEAADEWQSLLERYNNGKPITEDDILMPSGFLDENELPYDFSGADKEIPQIQGRKNKNLVAFVTQLDRLVKEITCLDCQAAGTTLPKTEAAIVVAMLDSLFTLCQLKGGEVNRRTIAQGTSATEAGGPDVVGVEIAEPGQAAA